jgi:hypothetical protein
MHTNFFFLKKKLFLIVQELHPPYVAHGLFFILFFENDFEREGNFSKINLQARIRR